MPSNRFYILTMKGDRSTVRIRADRMETTNDAFGTPYEHNFYLNDELVGRYFVTETRGWHSEQDPDCTPGAV